MEEAIVTLSETNFKVEVLDSKVPVLVDFWAPWCGPCRMIAPVIEDLAGEYKGRIKVGKLNVDENANLASKYGVMSIPTVFVFKNGEPQERIVGYVPKQSFAEKIDNLL